MSRTSPRPGASSAIRISAASSASTATNRRASLRGASSSGSGAVASATRGTLQRGKIPAVDRLRQTLATIEEAFGDAPRPPDEELLHERCFDDNDIVALYGVTHWRELGDDTVEREYAALSFLSPGGFRHFVPAYLGFALRRLDTGAAAVDSTIWSLSPDRYDDPGLQAFTHTKLEPLDERQGAATVAFLEAARELGDEYVAAEAELALAWWRA